MRTRYQAAILGLLLTAPALASPQEDSSCLIGRLSAPDVSLIASELQNGRGDATAERLRAVLEVCSQGQNWSTDRRTRAVGYAAGMLIRDGARTQLIAQGIDTTILDRWFARQNTEFRTTAFATMPRARVDAAMATLIGNELSVEQMERNAAIIGRYMSALMILERVEGGIEM